MPDEVQEVQQEETPSENQTQSRLDEMPSFDELGLEFSTEIVNLISVYANKIPLLLIVKILNNLATDVVFQNILAQVQFRTSALEDKLTNRSKLII